ncbi:hypothetical protein FNU76_01405 [Chitinimonas arctica]|uniref:Uncharacterized protein n=1 Tax=Chitinimonas arctica TaxID=2594795 RepID=A0A516SAE5_9NEIS|nr:hypothetical protein [Chitinimonas arctica]QDQ25117.1 hypothetical protein FNU76_01405 [Chitinimonas arctica]
MLNPPSPTASPRYISNPPTDQPSIPIWSKIGSPSYPAFLSPPRVAPVLEHLDEYVEIENYGEKNLAAQRHGVNVTKKKFIASASACALAAIITLGGPQLIHHVKEHKTARVATFLSGLVLLFITGFLSFHFLLTWRQWKLNTDRLEFKKSIFESRQFFYGGNIQ